jgi:hypothetical protein
LEMAFFAISNFCPCRKTHSSIECVASFKMSFAIRYSTV